MTNSELYINAFRDGLGIDEGQLEGLVFQGVPEWDSVGHMTLVAAIEDAFDIVLDTDDIITFDSFEKGKEILKKYEVEI